MHKYSDTTENKNKVTSFFPCRFATLSYNVPYHVFKLLAVCYDRHSCLNMQRDGLFTRLIFKLKYRMS